MRVSFNFQLARVGLGASKTCVCACAVSRACGVYLACSVTLVRVMDRTRAFLPFAKNSPNIGFPPSQVHSCHTDSGLADFNASAEHTKTRRSTRREALGHLGERRCRKRWKVYFTRQQTLESVLYQKSPCARVNKKWSIEC